MFYTIFLFQNVYRLLPLGYKNEKIAQSYHFFLRYANILFIFLKKTHPITLKRTIVLFYATYRCFPALIRRKGTAFFWNTQEK